MAAQNPLADIQVYKRYKAKRRMEGQKKNSCTIAYIDSLQYYCRRSLSHKSCFPFPSQHAFSRPLPLSESYETWHALELAFCLTRPYCTFHSSLEISSQQLTLRPPLG
uniref:Putative uncharacterized protein YGL109W n=1 Tax=Saccharomyces cerevisiae (strain ATCC 204508 / S288c) TaxID=559292 RepID=YGK9_YEAST|nr:RecName: Full=Putative uncharacterized protein YGL109W [Saccharomyces cerevisiae S288C]CAA66243.1 unnamed protein product [Saccharomyces cerevisiae]CAA96815.1 unnamed protein product [Saccharomyces cerevisiae]